MNEKMEEFIKSWAEKIMKDCGDLEYYNNFEEGYLVANNYSTAKALYENPKDWKSLLAEINYDEYPVAYDVADVLARTDISARTAERQIAMASKIAETKTVVTHFGYDLDNVSSTYALELWAKEIGILDENESLKIERVPAGQIKEGLLNVDTGGHNGNRFDDDTIVIDGDPKSGVSSACASLDNIIGGIIPEQIVEIADTRPAKISVLETRTGLSLLKYLTPDKVFELAKAGLVDKQLSDEQLEQFGLVEGHEKQEAIVQSAKEKIKQYTVVLPNGEKAVFAPEFIPAGSQVAYETGFNYYASSSEHKDKDGNIDGATFAITSKPGVKLPQEVLDFGKKLVEVFRIDEKTSGAFVHPNGQMVLLGGPKNPDVKLGKETPESILSKLEGVFIKGITKEHIMQDNSRER